MPGAHGGPAPWTLGCVQELAVFCSSSCSWCDECVGALESVRLLRETWKSWRLPGRLLPGQTPPLLPQRVTYHASLLSQDMGAGLAVVPLMGLLESIAVAKSFGKMPTTHASLVSQPGASPTSLACF